MNKPLSNSMICVDQSGAVGIIGDVRADGHLFYPFDKDGNTSEGKVVPHDSLTQATRQQIPASRQMPAEQLDDLGYADAPPAKAPRSFSKGD